MTETLSPLFDVYSASLFFIALKTVLTYVTYILAYLLREDLSYTRAENIPCSVYTRVENRAWILTNIREFRSE